MMAGMFVGVVGIFYVAQWKLLEVLRFLLAEMVLVAYLRRVSVLWRERMALLHFALQDW